ncbi:hypothetical protein TVAG_255900 [Trichomonas vaginalis G3]|uniref:Uncharacterized protein n=1 Tax=Trichomonas vaginalis (strain ATCC PRA-98 / G3) TaxID=412133 RepID=A2DYY7_TRIV3|nr:ankyrin repeats (many copies)-containing protein [Trichomonas vaginalis G3]EAY14398.1 hypothetical protein TVAG_255900 [Trichomonas vaginalis G3]KAI5501243.1 ankyrin repeats (many copies)-containing protein [Trichomonas vaginalis G3]|eukprot:XP_001326621.1 hypothetical protein [Trichomonas vaginalis G3]
MQDENGETALHKASKFRSMKTAKVLISRGARIYIKDNYGETALYKAQQQSKNSRIVEFLISNGARNFRDEFINYLTQRRKYIVEVD